MMRAHSLFAVALVAVGCGSPPPPLTGSCSVVGSVDSTRDRTRLAQLYAQHRQTLVVAGTLVLACGCGRRGLGGDSQARNLRGGTEGRDLGGGREARNLGGGTEGRGLRGGEEGRNLGGGREARGLRGGTEARDLGGGEGDLQCIEEPSCFGYQVAGSRDVSYYDGTSVRPALGGCVPQ